MKNKTFFLSFLLLNIWLFGDINQNNDVQIWLGTEFQKKISEVTNLRIASEVRFGDDVTKAYLVYLQGIADFSLTPHFIIGPGYRQNWQRFGNDWKPIYEPMLNIELKTKYRLWDIQHRSRFSYLFRPEKDFFQYRARFQFITPWKLGNRFTPYFSEELFFNTKDGFVQNRLKLGGIISILDEFHSRVFYMLRTLKVDHHWNNNHVFGLFLNFKF